MQVLDENGHYVMAGSEVRVFNSANAQLLGSRLVDTGSGYNSQNAKPVHIATLGAERVDIEVTVMSNTGRQNHVFRNISVSELTNQAFIAMLARN